MVRVDVMVDIETLGTTATATIIQISAAAFDIYTGELLRTYNRCVDIAQEKKLAVDGATLKWWIETDKELFAKLLKEGVGDSAAVLAHFRDWLRCFPHKETYLWGNGILFDNNFLKTQMEAIGLSYPIHYKNDRDVRTILNLAADALGMPEKALKEQLRDTSLQAHNAEDDVKQQIRLVCMCWKILTGATRTGATRRSEEE